MSIKSKVLIVEDEHSIRNFVSTMLIANGYDTIIAINGAEASSMAASHCPDIMLLDLGLPDIDGVQIIKSIRQWSQMPIIVVSARTDESDKVEALDVGADDYLTKPFGTSELLARIRTALRHKMQRDARHEVAHTGLFTVGELSIDYNKRKVFIGGVDVRLTQNEYKIVALLGKHAGRVLTYDTILKELWGPGVGQDNQILRVNMANIRRKIEKKPAEPEYIFTEIGVGYRMADADPQK